MRSLAVVLLAISLFSQKAWAKPELTVYTYSSFVAEWGPGPAIKSNFEKACDCTLAWVALPDGVTMLNRLKIEGEKTSADVVLGLDTSLLAEARALGLFADHGFAKVETKVPGGWSDSQFLPFDFGHFAVVYDSEKVKTPPKSLDDLINGSPDEKIILQDPRVSTPGLGFLLWMKAVYGDEAAAAWRKLKPRILTTAPGWSEAYALFTKGEAPMVLSYTTSPAYHMEVEKTNRFQAAAFAEGHYLQIEIAGAISSSSEIDLARQFLAFMLSPGFQDSIPSTNWMFPAGKTAVPLPASFGKLVVPEKTLILPPDEVLAHRRAWIDEWLNAISE